jgi:hypothetical protein
MKGSNRFLRVIDQLAAGERGATFCVPSAGSIGKSASHGRLDQKVFQSAYRSNVLKKHVTGCRDAAVDVLAIFGVPGELDCQRDIVFLRVRD